MTRLLLVGTGGFVGASFRYLLAGLVHRLASGSLFPYGTLAVNLSGCLAIGLLAGVVELRGVLTPEARLFLIIGLLGGFTTYSSFGWETIELLRDGQAGLALGNVLLHVALGLGAVWLGLAVAKIF